MDTVKPDSFKQKGDYEDKLQEEHHIVLLIFIFWIINMRLMGYRTYRFLLLPFILILLMIAYHLLFLPKKAFAQYHTIGGTIRNCATNAALPGASVSVFDGTLGQTINLTTDGTGRFSRAGWARIGDLYSVNPQLSAPSGYTGGPRTTQLGWTLNTCSGADTPLGSASYECQRANGGDCSATIPGNRGPEQCNFCYNPAPRNLCSDLIISGVMLSPSTPLQITAVATVPNVPRFIYGFYNMNNLYGPGNPKPIRFVSGVDYVVAENASPPAGSHTIGITYSQFDRPDLNNGGIKPTYIQVIGFFIDPLTSTTASPDPDCIVWFN